MKHLDQKGVLKNLFQVAQLGTSFDPKLDGVISAVSNLLDRPIEGCSIVTTNQSTKVQFYGWKSPIDWHQDRTGIIFLMPLYIEKGVDYLSVGNRKLRLQLGGVYALNDRESHATIGEGKVVAAFYGSFEPEEIVKNPLIMDHIVEKLKESCFK